MKTWALKLAAQSQNTWSCSSSAALNLKQFKAFSTGTTKMDASGADEIVPWKQLKKKVKNEKNAFSLCKRSQHLKQFLQVTTECSYLYSLT